MPRGDRHHRRDDGGNLHGAKDIETSSQAAEA